jgi:Ni,Fe-hydrogenase III large subunit
MERRSTPTAVTGARLGQPSRLRHLAAWAMAGHLTTFVVPDVRTARMAGLDVEATGLRPVAMPRHARVLLLVGDLPPRLAEAAAIVYAQMPRPRAILAAGTKSVVPLPTPDVSVSLDQGSLEEGVSRLHERFATGSWAADALVFTSDVVQDEAEDNESVSDGRHHGDMGHGDDHDQADNGNEAGHESHRRPDEAHAEMDHGGSQDKMHRAGVDHGGHEGMHHGEMDHGDMGFMSMVAMTRDLPRDRDGLPMERFEVPFGPLFPGLPAGLGVTFTLDGDVVVDTETSVESMQRDVRAALHGVASTFPDRLARHHRLDPVSSWLLARIALDEIAGRETTDATRRAHAGELERARAASHLGWLAEFARLLGDGGLGERATTLHLALLKVRDNDLDTIRRLRGQVLSLLGGFDRVGMVRRRLRRVGVLEANAAIPSPVGRASGIANDARLSDPWYQAIGFTPITRDEGDALARLRLRLDETAQSLDLILAAGTMTLGSPPVPVHLNGTASATIETPRGAASLELTVVTGQVTDARLTTPSSYLIDLVPTVTEGAEVADALIGVASLDLSPWDIVPNGGPSEAHQ